MTSIKIISVIITVYNRGLLLKKCLDSVLTQEGVMFEVLLIDDGSTDDSLSICKDYESRYSNIRVFHQENSGISNARNLGLDNARGEYICFHDDDDILMPGALKKLYDAMQTYNVDIALGNFERIDEDGCLISENVMPDGVKNRVISVDEYWKASFDKKGYFVFIVNWAKLYKKEVWADLRFPVEARKAGDEFVLADILSRCKSIYVLDCVVHRQTMTKNSITRQKFDLLKLKAPEALLVTATKLIKAGKYEYAIKKLGAACSEILKYSGMARSVEEKKEIDRLFEDSVKLGKELFKYMNSKRKIKYIGYKLLFGIFKVIRSLRNMIKLST